MVIVFNLGTFTTSCCYQTHQIYEFGGYNSFVNICPTTEPGLMNGYIVPQKQ